jgi:hypothetical protein
MYDSEIREYIKKANPLRIIVDEVVLGRARIDLLDLTDELHGYEIKSDHDDYSRLKNQKKYYNKYLSKITIIVGSTKKEEILELVPPFWGIKSISKIDTQIILEEIREPKLNPFFDKAAVCSLLWRSELLDLICIRHKVSKSGRYSKYRRWKLAYTLQKELSKDQAVQTVRTCFLNRIKEGWRLEFNKEEEEE